jgi:hypothetical protein
MGTIYRAYDRTSALRPLYPLCQIYDYPGAGSPTPTSFQLATSALGEGDGQSEADCVAKIKDQ